MACALGNARVVHAHDVDAGVARLGEVRLPVSCNAAAQKEFEVAMAYYHSLGPDLAARGKPPFLRRGGQREPSLALAVISRREHSLMITNTQSGTNVPEVADETYRINTPVICAMFSGIGR